MSDLSEFKRFLETLNVLELKSLLQDAKDTADSESERLISLMIEYREKEQKPMDWLRPETLEKWIVGSSRVWPSVASHVDLDLREMADSIMIHIQTYIWSDQFKKQEVVYPANWWEAFKECWFPGWLLKRFPVDRKRVVLSARALYHDYVYKAPSGATPYIIVEKEG